MLKILARWYLASGGSLIVRYDMIAITKHDITIMGTNGKRYLDELFARTYFCDFNCASARRVNKQSLCLYAVLHLLNDI